MKSLIPELVDLLTSGAIEVDEREEIIQAIERAPVEVDWTDSE